MGACQNARGGDLKTIRGLCGPCWGLRARYYERSWVGTGCVGFWT